MSMSNLIDIDKMIGEAATMISMLDDTEVHAHELSWEAWPEWDPKLKRDNTIFAVWARMRTNMPRMLCRGLAWRRWEWPERSWNRPKATESK